jgi:AraC-like DNA-binding protein
MPLAKASRRFEQGPDRSPSGVVGMDARHTPPAPAAPTLPREFDSATLFLLKECQDVLRHRLTESLQRLYADLTGLELHAIWHEPLPRRHGNHPPVLCPAAGALAASGKPPSAVCQTCQQQHWTPAALASDGEGRFPGACGTTNLRLRVRHNDACPLTLVLQARSGRLRAPEALARAEALLHLVHESLAANLSAYFAKADLNAGALKLQNLEAENARFRRELHARIPEVPATPISPRPRSRAQQIVAAMIEYIQEQYHHPTSLGEVARHLGMAPNYLCTLFSRTMGMTFHRYLEELRLAKAEELLSNPAVHVCDVAAAVGYASPNHFRNVFKAHEGHAPGAWRDDRRCTRPKLGR